MGKLSDASIRAWMKEGERFEGRSDGDGLYLRYRSADSVPRWLFRYQLAGKPRVLNLGTYREVSLANARKLAKEMRARVALGYDVVLEKKDRKLAAVARIDAAKSEQTVATLADDYFGARILGRWKHPNIVRSRIERDIKPAIGAMPLNSVRPGHIDSMLKGIVARGAPTIANDVLRWTRRMFDYAVRRELCRSNPAAVFDLTDAGGREEARTRWLTREELTLLFATMRKAKGWAHENTLTVKLLLMLATRKTELIAARIDEFDLDNATWHLPAVRTKTDEPLDIPLPHQAVACLRELVRLASGSAYLLPARRMETRMVPHISPDTINAAVTKCLLSLMPNVPRFSPHDFRRTARTHLEALGIAPHISERCLNHKLRGQVGVYNQHEYFEERKAALQKWADLLSELEQQKDN